MGELPHRQVCAICGRALYLDYVVSNKIWEEVVHISRISDIHCLGCFVERADEKLVDWGRV